MPTDSQKSETGTTFRRLTPGQRKFERQQAGAFLVLAKIKDPLVDKWVSSQNAVSMMLLIDLLVEHAVNSVESHELHS